MGSRFIIGILFVVVLEVLVEGGDLPFNSVYAYQADDQVNKNENKDETTDCTKGDGKPSRHCHQGKESQESHEKVGDGLSSDTPRVPMENIVARHGEQHTDNTPQYSRAQCSQTRIRKSTYPLWGAGHPLVTIKQ